VIVGMLWAQCSTQNDEWLGQECMEGSAQDKNQHSSRTLSSAKTKQATRGGIP
jgi:hypothetical protein